MNLGLGITMEAVAGETVKPGLVGMGQILGIFGQDFVLTDDPGRRPWRIPRENRGFWQSFVSGRVVCRLTNGLPIWKAGRLANRLFPESFRMDRA
jgi:hypothetical protein